jgi:hypothetical protein
MVAWKLYEMITEIALSSSLFRRNREYSEPNLKHVNLSLYLTN